MKPLTHWTASAFRRSVNAGIDLWRTALGRPVDLSGYEGVFAGIKPWAGDVPAGFEIDFLGNRVDMRFQPLTASDPMTRGGYYRQTLLPTLPVYGDGWLEIVDWFEAAREARGEFVMVTLGACFGAQAVGSYRALQLINPMPCRLVAVEAEPQCHAWVLEHFRNNGIDPDGHWIVEAAMSDSNDPVLFPVGAAGTGLQNAMSTNRDEAREDIVATLAREGRAEAALRSLLLEQSTGLTRDLLAGHEGLRAEIKLVSGITLKDVLGPFDIVDYLEADLQQSEIIVFPPFMPLLKKKVRRVHIGTHGRTVHRTLARLFRRHDWEIVFDFEPDCVHETSLGAFRTGDGVLTVRNPAL